MSLKQKIERLKKEMKEIDEALDLMEDKKLGGAPYKVLRKERDRIRREIG